MSDVAEVRYAKAGDIHIAYQVIGQGPDLVVLPEWASHLEHNWEGPGVRPFFERMASATRLISFDKRGVGLSDPVPLDETVSLEAWMDDVRAVLDAVGSERAALLGHGQGATMALLFAATFPERVSALVLVNAYARLSRAPDYPWGLPPDAQERVEANQAEYWGRGGTRGNVVAVHAPDLARDPAVLEWWDRLERLACSPATARLILRASLAHDVRHLLPTISVPTLVIHLEDDPWVRVAHGRYLAEHIPDAKYLELRGNSHWFWVGSSADEIQAEIIEFVTGARPVASPADRVLATLVFTDIVGSTEQAAAMGDERWKRTLDQVDAVTRRQVERFNGRIVKGTGDGHLMVFDGPGRAIRGAEAVRDAVRGIGLQLRTGIHTGEIERRGQDVGGIAVHIAARVLDLASAGEILVSAVIPPLVAGSGFDFVERGTYELKGVPDRWVVHEFVR